MAAHILDGGRHGFRFQVRIVPTQTAIPQGLKPQCFLRDLPGPEGPLFHGRAITCDTVRRNAV
jgi:hypothetical protein